MEILRPAAFMATNLGTVMGDSSVGGISVGRLRGLRRRHAQLSRAAPDLATEGKKHGTFWPSMLFCGGRPLLLLAEQRSPNLMSHRNLLAACPFAAMVLAALASPSQAQFKKPEPTPYDGKGTVEAVGFEGIQFKDADGKTIVVGFDFKTKPKVTVTGTAEPG